MANTNALLMEQLSQLKLSNTTQREGLKKLTADWIGAVEEAEQQEADLQLEREVCSTIQVVFNRFSLLVSFPYFLVSLFVS